MSEPLSLESVKAEFVRWRQQKKSPQCRAPDALKQKALALRAHHSDTEIVKALNISSSRLKMWDSASTPTTSITRNTPQTKPKFVPLSLADHNEAVASGAISTTCEQANGSRWQLQGCFSAQQLSALVSALNSQAGGCP